MPLTSQQRAAVHALIMQEASRFNTPIPILKSELRAAIDATDDFIEAQASSYNTALPTPARTSLSPKMKAKLFSIVAEERFNLT